MVFLSRITLPSSITDCIWDTAFSMRLSIRLSLKRSKRTRRSTWAHLKHRDHHEVSHLEVLLTRLFQSLMPLNTTFIWNSSLQKRCITFRSHFHHFQQRDHFATFYVHSTKQNLYRIRTSPPLYLKQAVQPWKRWITATSALSQWLLCMFPRCTLLIPVGKLKNPQDLFISWCFLVVFFPSGRNSVI